MGQERPLGPATLPYPGARILWPLVFLLNFLSRCFWFAGRYSQQAAVWTWAHRWNILCGLWTGLRHFANIFWRVLTLLSVGYLVYDRIYESDATISSPASDPNFAFEFPFTITNNSHVFAIRNVRWDCHALKIKYENNSSIENGQFIQGTAASIAAGQSLNIDCAVIGPKSRMIRTPDKPRAAEAVMEIALAYDADFFGLFSLHRQPAPTLFTWFADASNPRWIKGNFAR